MAYATPDDLEARGMTLTDAERSQAEVLLEDAAVYLDAICRINPNDSSMSETLKIVSCSMVRRSMASSASDSFGVSQQTISADIYSQSLTFANPSGDFYLTGSEKRLLGITDSYLTSLCPSIGGAYAHPRRTC